jgi:hypothetical protein
MATNGCRTPAGADGDALSLSEVQAQLLSYKRERADVTQAIEALAKEEPTPETRTRLQGLQQDQRTLLDLMLQTERQKTLLLEKASGESLASWCDKGWLAQQLSYGYNRGTCRARPGRPAWTESCSLMQPGCKVFVESFSRWLGMCFDHLSHDCPAAPTQVLRRNPQHPQLSSQSASQVGTFTGGRVCGGCWEAIWYWPYGSLPFACSL